MVCVTDTAIHLDSITKCFGSQVAVDNLNLSIPKGKTFGLLGQNGAGKTTTIKMMMGLESIDTGKATLLGVNVAQNPTEMKKRVGYVPETQHIYSWMTVHETIRFVSSFFPAWNNGLCDQMLNLFNLSKEKKVKHLSKGMLAKLSLLLAISHEPELLILDEPMTGLDPIVREEFLDSVLTTICQSNNSVFFSSHMCDDVQRLADEIGILYNGSLLVHRCKSDLLESIKHLQIKTKNGSLPKQLPSKIIWQTTEDRILHLVVDEFTPEVVAKLNNDDAVDDVELNDCSLENIFKYFVKGASEQP